LVKLHETRMIDASLFESQRLSAAAGAQFQSRKTTSASNPIRTAPDYPWILSPSGDVNEERRPTAVSAIHFAGS
jgi:hypothetical protein